MSRGLGKVQRELLEALQHHAQSAGSAHEAAYGLSASELAGLVYFRSPRTVLTDEKHLVAVRRALAGLARRGLVVRVGPLGFLHRRACRWHIGAWASKPPGA